MKTSHSLWMVLFAGFFLIFGYPDIGKGIEKDIKSKAIKPIRSTVGCGELEFDKATGGMKRKPNVELVVTRVEITRNDRGVWVKPWIKNRCRGVVTQHINVKIGEVVVTFAGLTPQVARQKNPGGK